jgi:hypothetical protein
MELSDKRRRNQPRINLSTAHDQLEQTPISDPSWRAWRRGKVESRWRSRAFRAVYTMINPCRMPRVTASVRVEALSLVKMEPT